LRRACAALTNIEIKEKAMTKLHRVVQLALFSVLAASATVSMAEVTVTDPWIRGTVTGQSETGAFMTIKSTEALKLVGASSPVARKVEVHKMEMDQGVMRMRPMSKLEIPANSAVALKPGSYHVMLMGISKPLTAGEKVPLTLQFQNKEGKMTSTTIQAEVRPLTEATSDMKMQGMKH
jgi:copper(I)-binding protein